MEKTEYIKANSVAFSGHRTIAENWRNRQTLWGGCTDANPKLLLNDT